MQWKWSKQELGCIGSPKFASYAALQRGIIYEREYAEWCRWLAERLEKSVNDENSGVDR